MLLAMRRVLPSAVRAVGDSNQVVSRMPGFGRRGMPFGDRRCQHALTYGLRRRDFFFVFLTGALLGPAADLRICSRSMPWRMSILAFALLNR